MFSIRVMSSYPILFPRTDSFLLVAAAGAAAEELEVGLSFLGVVAATEDDEDGFDEEDLEDELDLEELLDFEELDLEELDLEELDLDELLLEELFFLSLSFAMASYLHTRRVSHTQRLQPTTKRQQNAPPKRRPAAI